MFGAGDLPDAGEIGLTVGARRHWGDEVDLTVFGAGDAGGGEFHPLCRGDGGGEEQEHG